MTDPIGAIGTTGAAIMRGRRPMIAPTCHDLAELIDGDPATLCAWATGRLGFPGRVPPVR